MLWRCVWTWMQPIRHSDHIFRKTHMCSCLLCTLINLFISAMSIVAYSLKDSPMLLVFHGLIKDNMCPLGWRLKCDHWYLFQKTTHCTRWVTYSFNIREKRFHLCPLIMMVSKSVTLPGNMHFGPLQHELGWYKYCAISRAMRTIFAWTPETLQRVR